VPGPSVGAVLGAAGRPGTGAVCPGWDAVPPPNQALVAPREARDLGMRRNPMKLVVVTQWVSTPWCKSHLTNAEPAGQE